MKICLLGPFEVRIGSSPQPVAGRGERALLSLLALAAGRVVASSTLIDELWTVDDLPEDPGNALQLRVSKLRRALAALGEPERLTRVGVGYRLDVPTEDVDVHQFSALVEAARRTGEADQAVGLYTQALELWRGEPLVDFAGEPWTTVELARLDELRLAALAERSERLLTLGEYDRVVAELEPVVTLLPTRERLVAQLMTAMFNAGRQAEALELYNRTRRVLADELGIDPSKDLRAVMEQILRQDPAITPAPVVGRSVSAADLDRPRRGTGALPLRSTSFVGRVQELARTSAILAEARLVTLIGPGGAGKTALGIELARLATDRFRDGAVFVRLAAVSEREMLPYEVADAIGLTIEGGTATHRPRDVLVAQLRNREVLLVLDNCEHLIEPVASLVEAILSRCPEVRLIATSREALALPGEVQFPVSPLAVPAPGTDPDDIVDYPAAQLFLDRALAIVPDLTVDAPALGAVGEICQRLDGIPLALELAAARLASLSLSDLAERVQNRFAVLTSGSRTAEARQQTLRATVDWSHDLLTESESLLFRRLAVFRGGWTLDAAEQVVATAELGADQVLDLLDRLVRQSMVVTDRSRGHTRYLMLETLRQYAAGRLEESGELEELGRAHAQYYLALAEAAEVGQRGPKQVYWTQTLTEEHPNVRAALAWFLDSRDQEEGALRLAGSLGLFFHKGRHLEGRETLRRVMALAGGSPAARARAMQAVSLVERPKACIVHPSAQCAAAARNSLEIFEAVDDRPRATFSRLLLAVEGVGVNASEEAAALLADADREFAALDDEWGQAMVAFVRMETCTKRGDAVGAQEAADQAIKLFTGLGDGWGLSGVLYHRGWGVAMFGQKEEAVDLYERAIEVAAAAGVSNTEQWATAELGLTLLALGRVDEASACFERAGVVSDQVGDSAGRVLAEYGSAVLAQERDDIPAARTHFEAARSGFERLGVPLVMGMALAGVAACDELLGQDDLARGEYHSLLELAQGVGEVGLIATALEGLARAALANGDADGAAELLGRAGWLRETYGRPSTAQESATRDIVEKAAQAVLGTEGFAAATERGIKTGLG